MKTYVRGYAQRVTAIIATIVIVLVSSLLCYGFFHEKLYKISGQLNSYTSADYSTIYILNYGNEFDNECLYPDSDVQLYCDSNGSRRLTVTSVMREEGVIYSLKYLVPLSHLMPGEVCIPKNVADANKLDVGDTLFAEYPYSTTFELLTITEILPTEFDYELPIINNDVGVVFLGFNGRYANNTNSKFVLYAVASRANELSSFPQIINKVINKSDCISKVSSQGVPALLFEMFFAMVAAILAHMVFFSKSSALLFRCYLKGMKRILVVVIPLAEKLVFYFFPCVLFQQILLSDMPKSSIERGFKIIPIFVSGLYCAIMFALDLLKLRRKGGQNGTSGN